jgi:hypothetical protein
LKIFLKIFLMLILAALLLGAGYYLVIANISRLLAAGKPEWQCRWIASGLLIKTGKWSEVVDLRPPLKVIHQADVWIFHAENLTLTVNTEPKLRIQWQKSLSRRRSIMNGE